ncbi:hypothetical protein ANMWB30_22980 [Arthrobacter sp. MWB30]|nr:hypothetical protein ANMWB30_22980 [Arthrobacter sp. MWB30]
MQGNQGTTVREYKHEDFIQYVAGVLDELRDDGGISGDKADELVCEAKSLEDNTHESHRWLEEHLDIFPSAWDHAFTDYTFGFQMACYAVNATVQAYLEHVAARPSESKDPSTNA